MNKLSTKRARLTDQQFSEHIEVHKEKLYRFAYCYVKNEQDALEIVAEATYKAYLSFSKMKTPEYFETWITRIVINCSLDHIRRNKKYTSLENNPAEFVTTEHSLPFEDKWDLYEALDQLSPEEKNLIILKVFEDKRFKDLAEILSLTENTIKSKFYRTLDKLKKHLIKEEVDI
ncbi:sigma-70 family RNA polymerase sigma factor [Paenibacillus sp. FA6]|uniref:sigma-70 family RNA polymerase sigma factor n=1 Tax=Paenibacillus sp. FA6 TaxID=3413029 RepID=UPI003F65532B